VVLSLNFAYLLHRVFMYNEPSNPTTLRPKELEAVYAISRAVVEAESIESALEEITRLSRPVFIFDSMVLYLPGTSGTLDLSYARVIGRGQSSDGDLGWGELVAGEVYSTGEKLMRREQTEGWAENRLNLREFLGLPLPGRGRLMGALVFARFGGPTYTPDQVHLAEFIARHVAQLLGNKELVERVARLEAERRLERLQQDFIATISHELCTPLGFIKGYATTLLREDTTWDSDTSREFLEIIDEEADRLRDLIDNLLDSSRLQSGTLKMDFQPVRLDALIRDVSLRARSSFEMMDIRLNVKTSNLVCHVDPTRLAQVLENLLVNAAKYASGSSISVLLERLDSQVHISVADKGPGISPDHLEHIFKRFYRVPDNSTKARGTGLGLYICREIVNAHGGEINVASKVGAGTTFHIYLPCKQENLDQGQRQEEVNP
jgi:signal transduction histidine kinase